LQQHRVPHWYEKAKFGIFIPWGVYSVPAFGNEWYAQNMYIQGSGDLYWPSMAEADHMDVMSSPVPTHEFLADWLCRTCEIVDKYRPKIMYFDWWIEHYSVKPYLRKFAAYYYNRADELGRGGCYKL